MEVARRLAGLALGARLVACANLVPQIESHYRWQGRIECSQEVLVIFKTLRSRVRALESLVLRHHPYDTPQFVTLGLNGGNARYLDWIRACVSAPDGEEPSPQ